MIISKATGLELAELVMVSSWGSYTYAMLKHAVLLLIKIIEADNDNIDSDPIEAGIKPGLTRFLVKNRLKLDHMARDGRALNFFAIKRTNYKLVT